MEKVVKELQENVKELQRTVKYLKKYVEKQAAKVELLEKTVKKQNGRLDKLEAERPLPSGNRNIHFGEKGQGKGAKAPFQKETPVVRLVRLQLPTGYQECRSEEVATDIQLNDSRKKTADKKKSKSRGQAARAAPNDSLEGQETEYIRTDEVVERISESLATAGNRKVPETERSETLDLDAEIADKKRKNSRGAEPCHVSGPGTCAKRFRTEHLRFVKNKKCAINELRSTATRQPERRISTMPNSGPGKKNSFGVEHPKCTLCLKTFVTRQALHVHMRTHTGVKPFKCRTCLRAFASSGNMRSHMRTHTREKPFKCQTCRRAFAISRTLLAHMRTHAGEKPFECNVCRKSFSQARDLTVHARTHTGEKPFKCEVCRKAFTNSSDLRKHKRLHTGEKPFRCNFCSQTFTWRNSLVLHIRDHTGEKPFKCEVCGASCKQLSNLNVHKKRHISE